MKLLSTTSILALGTPIVMGLPRGAAVESSISIPPRVTGLVNVRQATSTVGSAPQVTPAPDQAAADTGNFMVTLVNSHTAPVVTIHAHGAGGPAAVGKDSEPHTMSRGQTETFAVPTGWSGRVAMFEDGYEKILDRATLLEGSFMVNQGSARIALDVSYVDAFTVPMVCECNNVVALGCNLNLNDICPKNLTLNAKTCKNPNREVLHGAPAYNPFEDCKAMAYTYPQDDLATKYDMPGCSRSTTCCIGTACKPHPGQKLCPAGDGQTRPCATP
ncbi:uncharacterized protein GGS22DRAFT_190815 [Annulohypoxylon maeteangense]|uniref:uncharacterized protein n=1 Tax=Annulohypoxylon maeteangense TaxID=1927788 RepID=UPI002007C16C|nr:uncharacterized protein GGS22DRAFT_190815 [Annulohypoxylon maeteangense]KAI0882835.1 hypothetical protein GGS22DRAFT_190815 [Annulohypoxylon maeteangense]